MTAAGHTQRWRAPIWGLLMGLALAGPALGAKPAPAVDLNHAGVQQLQTLPGVDAALARKIVAGRPYRSKADLVEKGVLTQGAYVALKHRAIVVPDLPTRKAGTR